MSTITYTYKQTTSKMIMLFLVSLTFTILEFYFAVFTDAESTYDSFLTYAGFVFFLILAIFFSYNIFSSKGSIVLTEDGFYDYSTKMATNDHLIEWKQVDSIGLYEMDNMQFIGVHLKNSEYLDDKRSSIQSMTASQNEKLGFGDIYIQTDDLKNTSALELIGTMTEYLEHSNNKPQE